MDFETRAIHAGQEPDPSTGAVSVPIYQTSTYAQEAVGVHKGYDYARVANPTRTALQLCLASLESAEHGIAFASGLGAVPGPFDCWLVLRGIKTLAVRMRQHCENAYAVADWLSQHPHVEKVLYPG